ncbi:tRNA pseudouridine(13) synthase TruD [Litoribacillus peritrichatus]|uniref:tRNA pseudouridine synthase D n=1 Tax=Litoribacillus peritrichatus TaxID=718191 RepID=A0ABP7N998_9GAMM
MSLFELPFTDVSKAPKQDVLFKSAPEDFQVFEIMGFEPSGDGEHLWLDVLKKGKNTQDLARDLAKHFNVDKNAVAYSGLKDKNAITRQCFTVHLPGKGKLIGMPVFRDVDIVNKTRHNKKLKTGVHQGNQFIITLRDVSDVEELIGRLATIKEQGFPNYFGHQRFGFDRSNLTNAMEWLITGKRPRQRFLEGMYLSALRSYIFNMSLAERVAQGNWNQLCAGDFAQFDWSKSGFVVENTDDDRCCHGEIHPAIALFDGNHQLPDSLAELADQSWFDKFRKKRFSPENRSLRIIPKGLSWTLPEEGVLQVSFSLPTGSYATSLLKEVCELQEPERKNTQYSPERHSPEKIG